MAISYFSNTNSNGTGSLYDTITSANAGDTVMPSSDFTDFEINITASLDIEKNITLDAGRHRIIITPSDTYGADISEVATVVFTNFTFNGGQTGVFIGNENSNVTFNQCKFYNNSSRAIDYIEDTANTTFNNCIITGCGTAHLEGTCNFCTIRGNSTTTLTNATLNNCITSSENPAFYDDTFYLNATSSWASQYDTFKHNGTIPQACTYDFDGNKRLTDGVKGACEMLDRSIDGVTKLFYNIQEYAVKNCYIGATPSNNSYFKASVYNNNSYSFTWNFSSFVPDGADVSQYLCSVWLYNPDSNISYFDNGDDWLVLGVSLSLTHTDESSALSTNRSSKICTGDVVYIARIGVYPMSDMSDITYYTIGFTYSGDLPTGSEYHIITPPQLFETASYWSTYRVDSAGNWVIQSFPTSGSVEYYVLDDVRFVDTLSHLTSDSETLHIGGYKTIVFGSDNSSSGLQNRRCSLNLNKYSYLGNSSQSNSSVECSNLTMGDDSKYYGKITRSNSVTHTDSCSSSAWIEEGEIDGCYKIPQNVYFESLTINRSATANYDSEQNADIYANELIFDSVDADDSTLKIDCASGLTFHCTDCGITDANTEGSWFTNAPTIYPQESLESATSLKSSYVVDLSEVSESVDLIMGGQVVKNNTNGATLEGSAVVQNETTNLSLWTLEENSTITFSGCTVSGTSYTIAENVSVSVSGGSLNVSGTLTLNGFLILDGQSNKVATLTGSGTVQLKTTDSILTITSDCDLDSSNFLVDSSVKGYLGVPVGTDKTTLTLDNLIVGDYGANIQTFKSKNGAGTVTQSNPVANSTFLVESLSGTSRTTLLTNVSSTTFDLSAYVTSTSTSFRTFDGENFVVTSDHLTTQQNFYKVISHLGSEDSSGVLTLIRCSQGSRLRVGQDFVLYASVYKDEARTTSLTFEPADEISIKYTVYKYTRTSVGYTKTAIENFVDETSYTSVFNEYRKDSCWKINEEGYNVVVISKSSPFAESGIYEIEVSVTLNDDDPIQFTKQVAVFN